MSLNHVRNPKQINVRSARHSIKLLVLSFVAGSSTTFFPFQCFHVIVGVHLVHHEVRDQILPTTCEMSDFRYRRLSKFHDICL